PDVRQPPSLPRVADPVGGADSPEHSGRRLRRVEKAGLVPLRDDPCLDNRMLFMRQTKTDPSISDTSLLVPTLSRYVSEIATYQESSQRETAAFSRTYWVEPLSAFTGAKAVHVEFALLSGAEWHEKPSPYILT